LIRLIKVLAATALMMVLMTTTVSPAFANSRAVRIEQETRGNGYWSRNAEKGRRNRYWL
jgi:phosphoribosyl-AMP cyclohydrolase